MAVGQVLGAAPADAQAGRLKQQPQTICGQSRFWALFAAVQG